MCQSKHFSTDIFKRNDILVALFLCSQLRRPIVLILLFVPLIAICHKYCRFFPFRN
ncbi:hypothetical protein JCM19053_2908 [Vibrio sp. JCM 19053]|nr:hypothetical protein JCM19053_2908 [Vibrio sp. JCM 19053]